MDRVVKDRKTSVTGSRILGGVTLPFLSSKSLPQHPSGRNLYRASSVPGTLLGSAETRTGYQVPLARGVWFVGECTMGGKLQRLIVEVGMTS